MSDYSRAELQLADYVAILKRRWVWFLLPLLVVPAAAYYRSISQPDRFDASSQVLLSDSAAQEAVDSGSQSIGFRARILENEISLARSDQAQIEMADRLGIDDPSRTPNFRVVAEARSDVLIFSASARSAEQAAETANVAAETYVALKQQQAQESIVGAVENLRDRLNDLQDEREATRSELIRLEDQLAIASEEARAAAQTRVDREASRISGQVALIDAQITASADSITRLELSGELASGGTARIVSIAVPPSSSSNASPIRDLVLGLVVGAMLGAGLAWVRETLDNKVRTTTDLEALGLVALGSIPRASKKISETVNLAKVSLSHPDMAQSQAHQKTQSAVRFLVSQYELSNVLITSASQSEGKTTLASNLAIAMARSNVRTVLVDVDLRRPRVHKAYELPQAPGITTVAVEGIDIVDSATLVPELDDLLAIVPAGKLPPHPASFISSTGFIDTVKEISKLSDFAVFDAPPVLPVADTLSLAGMVDGVIVVAYANETAKRDLESALESLRTSGADVLGAVLLGAKDEQSGYEYYADSDDLERM